MKDLFAADNSLPLPAKVRPTALADLLGQSHLVGHDAPLRRSLEAGNLASMILWGPPGVGKTTLARTIANCSDAFWIEVSAVMAGISDIRSAIDQAKMAGQRNQKCVLFIDEIHRFNKTQQDAFLPFIEDGTLYLIGATTENPSFALNRALLSRCQVYVLEKLNHDELLQLLDRGLDALNMAATDQTKKLCEAISHYADGDGRKALSALETIQQRSTSNEPSLDDLKILGVNPKAFDRAGDHFYEQISALHKSIRGSSPDASLYWLCRMLEGGCDPIYIARRLLRIASEDIGNADPRALQICTSAWDVQSRLGSPEGELALAQAVLYLASAPKSNAVYQAYKSAISLVEEQPSYNVPSHLRNAPTESHRVRGDGEGYHYAHQFPGAYVAGESYFPEELSGTKFYEPVDRGLEAKIRDKLARLEQLDANSDWSRYQSD